ncbi:hypothetical protein VTI74DRAFT_393 [Chaetomium olivicolor]
MELVRQVAWCGNQNGKLQARGNGCDMLRKVTALGRIQLWAPGPAKTHQDLGDGGGGAFHVSPIDDKLHCRIEAGLSKERCGPDCIDKSGQAGLHLFVWSVCARTSAVTRRDNAVRGGLGLAQSHQNASGRSSDS